jgi:hypothetical protein
MNKKARGALGLGILFCCALVFMWWIINTMDSNFVKIKSYVAKSINEECGTLLSADDLRFESEGTCVWYLTSPVRVIDCSEVEGLIEIPRPGRCDSE